MQQRFRLHRSIDIQRVRRIGKSYAHPLIVLVTASNESQKIRMMVSVSRRVGNAVLRNRVRRRIREAVRAELSRIPLGQDCVFIARPGCGEASYEDIARTVLVLLERAVRVKS